MGGDGATHRCPVAGEESVTWSKVSAEPVSGYMVWRFQPCSFTSSPLMVSRPFFVPRRRRLIRRSGGSEMKESEALCDNWFDGKAGSPEAQTDPKRTVMASSPPFSVTESVCRLGLPSDQSLAFGTVTVVSASPSLTSSCGA